MTASAMRRLRTYRPAGTSPEVARRGRVFGDALALPAFAGSRMGCSASMRSNQAIDARIGAAVVEAVEGLLPRAGEAGEEMLRAALVGAIRRHTDWVVDAERGVSIREFQGVGPVDIVLRDAAEAAPWGLIECKWSTDARRDRIFEGAWDAVKLRAGDPPTRSVRLACDRCSNQLLEQQRDV